MEDLIISKSVLEKVKISGAELLIEMAVHLYDTERLSMGQAKKLANLGQLAFQQELSKRNINIKYDIIDLEDDLATIKLMENNVDYK